MPPCCRALCEDTTVEKQILILLAAYKGGRFIRPMVDSILAQDVGGWRLILSDDGEDTAPILQEYADKYPDKITHYRSGRRFGSAQKHFMHLLEQFGGQADYIMFSDQDDVWHPDKVRLTLRLMEQAETDPALPVLVHTDLRVVDGQLHEMDPSFQHYSGLDGHRLALEQLLVQNVVTGCTMMINRSLARLACRPVGEGDMLMHDWWLALIAVPCSWTAPPLTTASTAATWWGPRIPARRAMCCRSSRAARCAVPWWIRPGRPGPSSPAIVRS